MPWTPDDANRHTHQAKTARLRRLWSSVANQALSGTGDDGTAIREANAVVRREVIRAAQKSRKSTPGPV